MALMTGGQVSFGVRLRRAIKKCGMSEAAFARSIEMSPAYLSRVLNDDSYRPEPETVRRFAAGLDMPSEEVAGWTDISTAMGLSESRASSPPPDGIDPEVLALAREIMARDELRDLARRGGPDFQAKLLNLVVAGIELAKDG